MNINHNKRSNGFPFKACKFTSNLSQDDHIFTGLCIISTLKRCKLAHRKKFWPCSQYTEAVDYISAGMTVKSLSGYCRQPLQSNTSARHTKLLVLAMITPNQPFLALHTPHKHVESHLLNSLSLHLQPVFWQPRQRKQILMCYFEMI